MDNLESHIIEIFNEQIEIWLKETSQINIDNKKIPLNSVILGLYNNNKKLNERNTEFQKNIENLPAYYNYISDINSRLIKLEETNEIFDNQIIKLIKKEIDPLIRENQKLKDEIDQLRKSLNNKQENKSYLSSISENKENSSSLPSDNIIEKFNNWAKDPKESLPLQFKYIDGELRLREKQDTIIGNQDSLWVENKTGQKIYIFPNPKVIEPIAGEIDAIYSINGTRRARGQNRIVIRKPCEIRDDGWIDYKGTLDII